MANPIVTGRAPKTSIGMTIPDIALIVATIFSARCGLVKYSAEFKSAWPQAAIVLVGGGSVMLSSPLLETPCKVVAVTTTAAVRRCGWRFYSRPCPLRPSANIERKEEQRRAKAQKSVGAPPAALRFSTKAVSASITPGSIGGGWYSSSSRRKSWFARRAVSTLPRSSQFSKLLQSDRNGL